MTISNSFSGAGTESVGGATSANSLAIYNVPVSLSSTNLFAANPVTIGGSTLSESGNLTLPASTTQNFLLGAGASTIAVAGNLTLDGTLNITSAPGFAATNYTLFTYTGSLSGQPSLGAAPANFEGYTYSLNTNAAHAVILQVSPPPPPIFSSAALAGASPAAF